MAHTRTEPTSPLVEQVEQSDANTALPPPAEVDPSGWQQGWGLIYLVYADALERYARGLLRRYGATDVGGEDPSDLVQGFFSQMMESDGLRSTSEIRDLDAFLYTAFWRYIRGRYRRSTAQMRRPAGGLVSLRLDTVSIAACAGARIEEPTCVHRAVEDALSTLQARRPRYAAVIEDLIEADDDGHVSSDLADRLGIAARNLATLKYRARRAFGVLFVAALTLIVGDASEVRAIQLRFLPWLPVLQPQPAMAA